MTQAKVSVIIVSYNTCNLTLKCLRYVLASTGFAKGEIEVIVVDNNSPDQTVSLVKNKYPQVKLIVSKKNLGFGQGNNLGVKYARGNYLLLLNTDAFLKPTTLSQLYKIVCTNNDLIATSPLLKYQDGSLQQSAGYFPTPLRIFAWMTGLDKLPITKKLFPTPYHYYDTSLYTKSFSPDWLMGACVLLPTKVYKSVGGFDQHIFMYAEEVELFYRLNKLYPHQKTLLSSKLSIMHLGSFSSAKAKTSRLLAEFDGIKSFYKKHLPNWSSTITTMINLGVIIRIVVFSFIPDKRNTVSEYLKYFGQHKMVKVQ